MVIKEMYNFSFLKKTDLSILDRCSIIKQKKEVDAHQSINLFLNMRA